MAAVKKSMWSNIIKMKLTEEKRYWNVCLQLFLTEVRLNCVGNVHNVSSTCVADFNLILINININDKIIVLVDQM